MKTYSNIYNNSDTNDAVVVQSTKSSNSMTQSQMGSRERSSPLIEGRKLRSQTTQLKAQGLHSNICTSMWYFKNRSQSMSPFNAYLLTDRSVTLVLALQLPDACFNTKHRIDESTKALDFKCNSL